MQIVKCWDIQVWDGCDRNDHKFYVSSSAEGDKWKEKAADNRFDTVREQTFEIYDTIEEYLEGKSEETRKRALAKLTPIERKSLGFN